MCGINGFSWRDADLIERMNSVISHRGPDDYGVFLDDCISLGHRRLSIIDLSEAGHQPMSNEDASVWTVYNGEVYNAAEIRKDLEACGHMFKGRSDTEVVLHAWEEYGADCLDKFNGMWAFAVYDKNRSQLFLARDRFGIKPLYYFCRGGRLAFSSMISALLLHDIEKAPCDRALMEFLAFNLQNHREETFFKGIHSLEPGCCMTFSLKDGSLHKKKWYEPDFSGESSIDEIRACFEESVRLRTISDVPVGSCLSGGIDSSAIVCSLGRILSGSFRTYSLVVPGHKLDERKYIEEVGRATGAEQFFTTIDTRNFIDEIDDFISAQEEPVMTLSPYAQYRVMKLAAENRAKVLLDGQGGDEIFAGYVYYFSYYFHELLKNFRALSFLLENIAYIKNFCNFFPQALYLFQLMPGKLKKKAFRSCVNPWLDFTFLEESCGNEMDWRWKASDLKTALKLTLFHTAIPHLLRWEDKNSMRWSIESRVPFLDVRLVEAAMKLPSCAKLANGRTKTAFRQAVSDILPGMIKDRRDKIGFGTPDDEFFRKPETAALCRDIFSSKSFMERPYWDYSKVKALFDAYLEGRKNIGKTVMKWLNLELWLRKYFD